MGNARALACNVPARQTLQNARRLQSALTAAPCALGRPIRRRVSALLRIWKRPAQQRQQSNNGDLWAGLPVSQILRYAETSAGAKHRGVALLAPQPRRTLQALVHRAAGRVLSADW